MGYCASPTFAKSLFSFAPASRLLLPHPINVSQSGASRPRGICLLAPHGHPCGTQPIPVGRPRGSRGSNSAPERSTCPAIGPVSRADQGQRYPRPGPGATGPIRAFVNLGKFGQAYLRQKPWSLGRLYPADGENTSVGPSGAFLPYGWAPGRAKSPGREIKIVTISL